MDRNLTILKASGIYSTAALLLFGAAIYNGYPLTYPDTGATSVYKVFLSGVLLQYIDLVFLMNISSC
jgi:hypothetical protein